MDGAFGTELAGQLFPLAARTHSEDDAVERLAPVGVVPATGFGWPEFLEQREDALPEGVRDFPDGPQGLAFGGFPTSAFRSSCCCCHCFALPGDASLLLTCANTMPWNRFSDSFLSDFASLSRPGFKIFWTISLL